MLFIKDDICKTFAQLQDFVRLISTETEIYSDILEYGRNGDLSEWLREHGKEVLADQINAIDNTASDNEYIKKISLIILDMIPALRKTNFRECFEQKVELAQTQQNELMLLFSLIPIKDINEDYEIKAVCGLMTKTITFNPSKYDIGVETKKTILYENESVKCLDSIVVYIDGEKIYEDSLKNYYFHSKYEILRKKVYIGSLSEIYLKELIIHYFKATSIYNISQITESNFAVEDFLKLIYDITGIEIDKKNIEGKTIDEVTDYLRKESFSREKENWNSLKKSLGVSNIIDIKNVELNDFLNLIDICSQSKDVIYPWDIISTSIDIVLFRETFLEKFGILLSEEEIKKQSRIDNLIMYIINKTKSKQLRAYTMGEVGKNILSYRFVSSPKHKNKFKSFSSKSDVFNYVKEYSNRPNSLSNSDSILKTVELTDLCYSLMSEYGIVLEIQQGTIKDLVNAIWTNKISY